MRVTVTLKLKLETFEQVSQSIAETQKAYAMALNHTSDVASEKKVFSSVALHHITYRDIREMTKLPANLVCSARGKRQRRCGTTLERRQSNSIKNTPR
jgi:predicted transposase